MRRPLENMVQRSIILASDHLWGPDDPAEAHAEDPGPIWEHLPVGAYGAIVPSINTLAHGVMIADELEDTADKRRAESESVVDDQPAGWWWRDSPAVTYQSYLRGVSHSRTFRRPFQPGCRSNG